MTNLGLQDDEAENILDCMLKKAKNFSEESLWER